MCKQSHPFHPESGIAIGPILFVIAILGILAAAMASGVGSFGTAGTTDRINADSVSQANLIRTKIYECNMQYIDNASINGDGYPDSGGVSVDVSTLICTGDNNGAGLNLWTGARPAFLPPPTAGFNNWNYINANSTGGGRCIWIIPSASSPLSNAGLVAGLTRAASKFTHGTAYNAAYEVVYNPAGTSQKFVLWITMPTGTPATDCTSP